MSSHKDTYNRQYQTFSQKPREFLDDCFTRFESIVGNLRACGPLTHTNNEHVKQLLYALNDHMWGMKITTLKESVDFDTLDTEKLFSKLKSHELPRKGHPNHHASFLCYASITSAHVGGQDANPTNTISPSLEFVLSSLAAAFDEQYKSISDDKIALLSKKIWAIHKFQKERRRTPETPKAALSAATPPISSSTALRGGSTTTQTKMTTTTRMTTRKRIASGTRRRTSRGSCPEHV
jgi:hypothetical protein